MKINVIIYKLGSSPVGIFVNLTSTNAPNFQTFGFAVRAVLKNGGEPFFTSYTKGEDKNKVRFVVISSGPLSDNRYQSGPRFLMSSRDIVNCYEGKAISDSDGENIQSFELNDGNA